MTEQEAQVLRDTATSAEQNALLNSQKLVNLQDNYDNLAEVADMMIQGAANMLDIARDADRLAAENKTLRDMLAEAATDVEYYAQYAGEYLSKKHNIADSVTTYRAAATGEVTPIPATDYVKLYEELRQVIDGGSESMTHKDAIKAVKYWQDRVDALETHNTMLRDALEQIISIKFSNWSDGAMRATARAALGVSL